MKKLEKLNKAKFTNLRNDELSRVLGGDTPTVITVIVQGTNTDGTPYTRAEQMPDDDGNPPLPGA